MIINLTGIEGSGKTSIAKELEKIIPKSITIDSADIIGNNIENDYYRSSAIKAYDIALFLEDKGFTPIISLVSPHKDLRDDLKLKSKVLEIYLFQSKARKKGEYAITDRDDYKKPTDKFVPIDTTNIEASRAADEIFTCLSNGLYKHLFNR